MGEEAQPHGPWRRWKHAGIWVLKSGFTMALLWLAFRKVPLAALRQAWGQLHAGWAVGCVVVYVPLVTLAESARFQAAARRVDEITLPYLTWVDAFLESRPWYYLLPASAGADAVIWYRLRRKSWSHGECGFVVLSVRLWGLAQWAMIAGITLAFAPATRGILAGVPAWLSAPWLWVAGGIMVGGACIAGPNWLASKEHVRLRPRGTWDSFLNLALASLSALFTASCLLMAAHSAGLPFDLLICLGLIAWFNFAMALPISLGGLGLQEALVLRLGLPLGIPAANLLAFSALLHLMRAALAVVGGLVSVAIRNREAKSVLQP